jgi:UDP-glucose 4-epimerase
MVLGHDARLQFVHELDAVGVLEHLALGDFAGTVNVAGDGVLTLAQAIHRAGRVPLPVPALALDGLSRTMRTLRLGGFSPSQVKMLCTGRVLDTTRLVEQAGYRPLFSTIEAFDDFASTLRPALTPETVRRAEVRIAGTLGARPLPVGTGSKSITGGGVNVIEVAEPDTSTRDGAPEFGAESRAGIDQPVGRPRLVGITGDGAGTPRRRRTR